MHNKQALNIGIFAHVDGGKTTLTEQMLYKAGVIRTLGRVDSGSTVTDSLSVEKARGITVKTGAVSFSWKGQTINILDTPGHMDFIAEVERSMTVLDAAILVISAKEGVQVQTKKIFKALKKLQIPSFIYINKVDRLGVDLEDLYLEINAHLSSKTLILERVSGVGTRQAKTTSILESDMDQTDFYESLALLSDDFMVDYLDNQVTKSMVSHQIKSLFNDQGCFPILHGAALLGLGITSILDRIVDWVEPKDVEGFSAKVFKVDYASKGIRRCYLRIFAGHLKLRDIYIKNDLEDFKILNLYRLSKNKQERCELAYPGEIVIIESKDLMVEDYLGTKPPLVLDENISTPTLKAEVAYEHLGQRKEILDALEILTDEDPFLNYKIHPFSQAIEIQIFGRVQKEILIAELEDRFDIKTDILEPQTLYKERPLKEGTAFVAMYKDTFLPATIGLKVEPLPLASGFKYENQVSFGDLKKSFQNGVYEGIIKTLAHGPLGYPLTDIKVTFTHSDFDSVNSTPSAYRDLAQEVMTLALRDSQTELLEPLLHFEIDLCQDHIGRAISDILAMKGQVEPPKIYKNQAKLTGIIPVETSMNYAMVLADYSSGKATLHTAFYGYRPKENQA